MQIRIINICYYIKSGVIQYIHYTIQLEWMEILVHAFYSFRFHLMTTISYVNRLSVCLLSSSFTNWTNYLIIHSIFYYFIFELFISFTFCFYNFVFIDDLISRSLEFYSFQIFIHTFPFANIKVP